MAGGGAGGAGGGDDADAAAAAKNEEEKDLELDLMAQQELMRLTRQFRVYVPNATANATRET